MVMQGTFHINTDFFHIKRLIRRLAMFFFFFSSQDIIISVEDFNQVNQMFPLKVAGY